MALLLAAKPCRPAIEEGVMTQDRIGLSPDEQRVLVTELAEAVLDQTAPEELLIFDETAEEFFQNPERMLNRKSPDEPVEIALLTPYVLAVVGPVVSFLISVVTDSVKEASKTATGEWVRSLLKRKADAPATAASSVPGLTKEQARQVHEIAYERATTLGLSEATAQLLADSVIGGVLVAD
jgi:hypothetical protein